MILQAVLTAFPVLMESMPRDLGMCHVASVILVARPMINRAVVNYVLLVPTVTSMDVQSVTCVNQGQQQGVVCPTAQTASLDIIRTTTVSHDVSHVQTDGICQMLGQSSVLSVMQGSIVQTQLLTRNVVSLVTTTALQEVSSQGNVVVYSK